MESHDADMFGELRALCQKPLKPKEWHELVALVHDLQKTNLFQGDMLHYVRTSLARFSWTQRQIPPSWMNRLVGYHDMEEGYWELRDAPARVPELELCTTLECGEVLPLWDHSEDGDLMGEFFGQGRNSNDAWELLLSSEDLGEICCLRYTVRGDDYATLLLDWDEFLVMVERWPTELSCLSIPGYVDQATALPEGLHSLELMESDALFGERWGYTQLEHLITRAPELERLHIQGFDPSSLGDILELTASWNLRELFVDSLGAGRMEEHAGEAIELIANALRLSELSHLSTLCISDDVMALLRDESEALPWEGSVNLISGAEAWGHGWDTYSHGWRTSERIARWS